MAGCKNGCYYFISPYGLGDSLILCILKPYIEGRLGGKVEFVIKPSHECVMRMYGIDDYIIMSFTKDALYEISERNPEPKEGKLFVAHPDFYRRGMLFREFLCLKVSFIDMYKIFFQIPDGCRIKPPVTYPGISGHVWGLLGGIDIKKIIAVAPEHSSEDFRDQIDADFFENYIKKKEEEGYFVIVNESRGQTIKSGHHLNLTLEEFVALCIKAEDVISARSGLCDLIYAKVKHMTVIYPNQYFYDLYNFGSLLNPCRAEVDECVLPIGSYCVYYLKNTDMYGRGDGYDGCAHFLYQNLDDEAYFLKCVKNAIHIFADNFEGACLAFIFNKDFTAVGTDREMALFLDLVLGDKFPGRMPYGDAGKPLEVGRIDFALARKYFKNENDFLCNCKRLEKSGNGLLGDIMGTYRPILKSYAQILGQVRDRQDDIELITKNRLYRGGHVICWGYGNTYKRNIYKIMESHIVDAVCDSNKSLWGEKTAEGIEIIPPAQLEKHKGKYVLVTVDSVRTYLEIVKGLIGMGIKKVGFAGDAGLGGSYT